MNKKCIAVITARADASEQKDVLSGISSAAFSLGHSVAVFSNIYNHWADDKLLNFENIIYDLFDPLPFCGVIITAEAFKDISILNGAVKKICDVGIPCVVIDGSIDGLMSLWSDDSYDLERIAEHLICSHGFRNIDVLTCKSGEHFSERRLEGVLRAFAHNGIMCDENKIFYSGNFWSDSGEKLAKRYISGELSLPQAVICINDYMAFGLCSELIRCGIKIPEDITVIGYDSSEERILHFPFLTTCRRDRRGLGIKAVEIITNQKNKESPRKSEIIYGLSCPCGLKAAQIHHDVDTAFSRWNRTALSSFQKFSGALTACRTLSEYTSVLSEYFHMLSGVSNLTLCLDKAWNSQRFDGEEFLLFEIDGVKHSTLKTVKNKDLPSNIIKDTENPAMYFFSPFYYQMRLFGYMVQRFDKPGSYDFSFLDWSKVSANALEFLRMKNDIDYLTQCQKISKHYDAIAGFCTLNEFRRIVDAIDSAELSECVMYSINLNVPEESRFSLGENYINGEVSVIASAIRKAVKSHEALCVTSNNLFLILSKNPDAYFFDRLKAMVCYDLCSKDKTLSAKVSFNEYRLADIDLILKDTKNCGTGLKDNFVNPHYKALLMMRRNIYSSPKLAASREQAAKSLCLSTGYFAATYKKFFGISYNNDCINAKIMRAKYLLCTTVMSIYAVAIACGYTDEKYFARQFRQSVGCSPMQYRNIAY